MRAHFAADRADVETLRQLLAAGLSPDAEYDGTPVVWNGKTPLLTLCIAWHDDAGDRVGCFKLLRDAGANLEATDRLGRTPLHCAATAGKPDLLSLLIQAGVNVEAVDRYANATALHDAASSSERGVVDCVELLLAAGADMDARDTSGRRPFDIALTDNCPRLFPLFLRAGAEVPTTMITRLSYLYLSRTRTWNESETPAASRSTSKPISRGLRAVSSRNFRCSRRSSSDTS